MDIMATIKDRYKPAITLHSNLHDFKPESVYKKQTETQPTLSNFLEPVEG
jgi:hypothetical protein